MRVFQNLGISSTYTDLHGSAAAQRYDAAMAAFLDTRYGAPHILDPVLDGAGEVRLAIGNGEAIQLLWARERGLRTTDLSEVLLAQIEDSRAEVFYNCDPLSFGNDFVRRLPGNIRRSVAWSAAPHGSAQFLNHDIIVCNFPNILAKYASSGARTSLFYPAHDPVMEKYHCDERDIDIVFAGSYSRHHAERNQLLNAVARLSGRYRVMLCVQPSRMTRIAEAAGRVLPIPAKYKRPAALRRVCKPPRYGRELYELFGRAKIVLNGAIGMAGGYRGNLRVWEGAGAGALLLSDAGIYPEGFEDGVNYASYHGRDHMVEQVHRLLGSGEEMRGIAKRGHVLIRERYGKRRQWETFVELCA